MQESSIHGFQASTGGCSRTSRHFGAGAGGNCEVYDVLTEDWLLCRQCELLSMTRDMVL